MSGAMTSSSSGPAPGMKICPYCAEEIREAAVKCRFCHSYLTGDLSEAGAPPPPVDEPVEEAPPAPALTTKAEDREGPKVEPKPSRSTKTAKTTKTTKTTKTKTARGRKPATATTRFPVLARPVVVIVLSVVVVLVLAADAFLLLGWHGYRQEADARSSGQVEAVNDAEKILSFDYKTVDKSTAASEKLMTARFKKKYSDTAERVRADAPGLKAVVKAQVVASSVVSAKKDKVKTLLFVNQTTTRTNLAQPRVDLNRVEVTLVKDGNDWRVDNIQAL